MRVGIYLGRGWERSDIYRGYLQSLVSQLVLLLPKLSENDEIVFLGDESILFERMLEDLSFCEVLTAEVREGGWYVTAGRFFRKLPNGARCRVLFRVLDPVGPGGAGVSLVDYFLIPFFVKLDRIDVLHSIPQVRFPFISCPQILTVVEEPRTYSMRDLGEPFARQSKKVSIFSFIRKLLELCRQSLSHSALGRTNHVICFTKNVRNSVSRQFGVSADRISIIDQGLEPLFAYWANSIAAGDPPEFPLDDIEPGYCLTFFFREDRECFQRSIAAWRSLEENQKSKKLVVAVRKGSDARKVKRELKREILEESVHVFEFEDRANFPNLIFGSDVVLMPSEKNSITPFILGVLALQTEVVCGQLEALVNVSGSEKRLSLCNAKDAGSVLEALYAALESGHSHAVKEGARLSRRGIKRQSWSDSLSRSRRKIYGERIKLRTIQHVSAEFFEVYRNIDLRYNARQS